MGTREVFRELITVRDQISRLERLVDIVQNKEEVLNRIETLRWREATYDSILIKHVIIQNKVKLIAKKAYEKSRLSISLERDR